MLSPGTARHDQRKKIPAYERAGVLEVWLVNPRDRNVAIYRLSDGVYGRPAVLNLGDELPWRSRQKSSSTGSRPLQRASDGFEAAAALARDYGPFASRRGARPGCFALNQTSFRSRARCISRSATD